MLDSPLDLALLVTLWASVGGFAMSHAAGELVAPLRRTGLVVRVAAFDVLIVPPATWAVVSVLHVPDPFAIGLILVGAASAGPLGLVAAQIARADTALALALVATLEVANAVAVPAWAALLLPRGVTVPVGELGGVLLAYVVLPLVVGAGIRVAAFEVADRLVPPLRLVTAVGLVIVVALLVAGNAALFVPAAEAGVPIATAAIIAVSLAGGWLVAGGTTAARKASALVVAQRGSSIALAIAVTVFADVPEVAVAVVVFATISIIAVSATALGLRRVSPPPWRPALAGGSHDPEAHQRPVQEP